MNERFGLLIELTSPKTKKQNADPLKYSAVPLISAIQVNICPAFGCFHFICH